MSKERDFDDYLLESLKDPEQAKEFLNVAIEEYYKDKDRTVFINALTKIVKANHGISSLSKNIKTERSHLNKIIKGKVKPSFYLMCDLLDACGYRLVLEQKG